MFTILIVLLSLIADGTQPTTQPLPTPQEHGQQRANACAVVKYDDPICDVYNPALNPHAPKPSPMFAG